MKLHRYVASPYSHPEQQVRTARYTAVCELVGMLSRKHLVVFSPIAHYHTAAVLCRLPTDANWWKFVNSVYLQLADELCVACLPGWEDSIGVQWEIEFAVAHDKPITYINVDEEFTSRHGL